MINYNLLQNIEPPKTIGALPGAPSGGNDVGGLLEGLGQFIGAIKGQSSPSQANAGTALQAQRQAPGLIGTQGNIGIQKPQEALGSSLYGNASKLLGQREGSETLKSFLAKSNPNLDPNVTPWCAGFVGSVLNSNGMKGTGSLMAKSYLKYGTPTNNPSKGDIVVFNDLVGNSVTKGHVGFVDSINPETGMVRVLGGNQDNSVSIKEFPLAKVAGFRQVPKGSDIVKFAQNNRISSPQQLSNIPKYIDNSDTHPMTQRVMGGIAHVESSGTKDPYTLVSKASKGGDRAYGKYQIMGSNIPMWTKEATGKAYTPFEYLQNPALQEQTAQFQINNMLKRGVSPTDAASIWFTGRPYEKAKNAKDAYGTTNQEYRKKFMEGLLNTSMNDQNMSPNDAFRNSVIYKGKDLRSPQDNINTIHPNTFRNPTPLQYAMDSNRSPQDPNAMRVIGGLEGNWVTPPGTSYSGKTIDGRNLPGDALEVSPDNFFNSDDAQKQMQLAAGIKWELLNALKNVG